MRDLFIELWATTRRNKLRTALTGFAVAWGIFMLIFLLGAGNGLINGQTHNMHGFLSNSMMVGGGTTSQAFNGLKEGRPVTLNDKDMATSKHRFRENVDTVGAELFQNGVNIANGANYINVTLNGVYPCDAAINKVEVIEGRFINDIDNAQRRRVIVLTQSQAKELQPQDYRTLVGMNVKAGNFSFRVVGISKDDETSMSESAYTPFNTLRTMYGRGDKADQIVFTFKGLKTEAENEAFEKQYKASINRNHDAAPDDEDAIWIWNRFTSNMQMNQGVAMIRTSLWIVGIFTLLSGIVGVSNIMLISVRERTREFGVRKAIGAKPWSILKLIIVESIIITTFFGYIGMLLGIAANQYMDMTIGQKTMDIGIQKITTFLNPTVGLDVCVEATLLMVVAGTMAGLIPARRAAHIRPIEALRSE